MLEISILSSCVSMLYPKTLVSEFTALDIGVDEISL